MLTEVALRKAQPRAKPYRMVDRDGLHALVQPNGSKLWQGRYRLDGKERTVSHGKYPDVSLAQARERHAAARKLLAQGVDPVAAKRAQKLARAQQKSFEEVARVWYEAWKQPRSERHAGYVLRRLEADVFPVIGPQGVGQITAPELVRMLKKIERRGALDIAKRVLQTCGQIFRYAVAHGWAERNPAADVKPSDVLAARKKENFARVDVKELPGLMRKIDLYEGNVRTRLAMKLLALTFVRTGELTRLGGEPRHHLFGGWTELCDARKNRLPSLRNRVEDLCESQGSSL